MSATKNFYYFLRISGYSSKGQACVTFLVNDKNENHVATTTATTTQEAIVVIGGGAQGEWYDWYTNAVIVWDPFSMKWKYGPNLNEKRKCLVSVVCHDKVYVIGGCNENGQVFDTLECIHISSLLLLLVSILPLSSTDDPVLS